MKRIKEIFGIIILVIPIISTFIILYWAAVLSMLQFYLVVVGTLITTGILTAVERRSFPVTDNSDLRPRPVRWAILVIVLWFIGFPAHLANRARYGMKNMLVGGIVVAMAFILTVAMVGFTVHERAKADRPQQQNFEPMRHRMPDLPD